MTSPHNQGIDVFNVLGVDYYIDWRLMKIGASFFIPTTATPAQVLRELRLAQRVLRWRLVARARCEYGIFGVRVWRTH